MIPAGGSGKLTAKVKTAENQHGSFSKSVTLHTDVAGAEDLRLSFSFTVVPPILVLPNQNLVLSGLENEQVQAMVVLHRSDGKPLELSDLHSSLPVQVRLAVRQPTRAELDTPGLGAHKGDLVLEATLPPQPEVTRQVGEVTVTTNHPDEPQLRLPLTLMTRPVISVRPGTVRLRVTEGASPQRTVPVRLSSMARRPFKITAVEVSRPDLIEVDVDSQVPMLYHRLQVKVKEGVDSSRVADLVQASLKLETSDPARPSLEIPVVVLPGRPAPASTRTPGP